MAALEVPITVRVERFPLVVGRCPACGCSSLFVGNGGYVTCSIDSCPDSGAASDLLERAPAVRAAVAKASRLVDDATRALRAAA